MKKVLIILIFLILLISVSQAGSDLQFVSETPEIHPSGTELLLEAEITTEENDQEIILEKEVDDGFNEELTRTTCSSWTYCTIDYEFDPQEELENNVDDVNFIVFTTDGAAEDQHEISFREIYIDDLYFEEVPPEDASTETEYDIVGTAEGAELKDIELFADGDHLKTKYCDDSERDECSIEYSNYEELLETEVEFELAAIAGDDYAMSQEKQVSRFSDTSIDTIEIEVSDKEVRKGDEVSASSYAEGAGLDKMQISKRKTGGSWERVDTDCEGFGAQDCDIEETFELDEITNYEFEGKVFAGDKTERTDIKTVEVSGQCGIDDNNIRDLRIDPSSITENEDAEASVRIDNDGDAQDVKVEFLVEDTEVDEIETEIPRRSGETVSTTIQDGDFRIGENEVEAIVRMDTQPCGDDRYDRTETLEVDEAKEINAEFAYTPENPVVDQEINFDPSDSTPSEDEEIDHHNWTLGDGTELQEEDISHTYSEADTYDVTLWINDTSGETDQTTKTVDVSPEIEDGRGEIRTIVENVDGDRLEDARVRAENTDQVTRRTDENGRTSMELAPDTYEVEAHKPGYATQTRTISVDEGERIEETFVLEQIEDTKLTIDNVKHDSTVCKDRSLEVRLELENRADSDQVVELVAEGFDERIVENFEIEEGEILEKEIMFTRAKPLGEQELEFELSNGYTDVETSTVEVEDCRLEDTRKPTGLTAEVSPREILSGETAVVRGYVDGVRSSKEVEIQVDGRTATKTDSRRDGYYTAYIRPTEVGTANIDVKAGDITTSRSLEVLQTAYISHLDAPERVFQGEEFEICADIQSQRSSQILLLRDGEVIQSEEGRGETCFTVVPHNRGEQEYEINALTEGTDGSASKVIEVLEQGNQVESFPDQVASVRSGDSIVRAEIYNTEDSLQTYDVSLDGIPETWMSQSKKTVNLPKGERETVYFYLTPREEGEFRPKLNVEANGEKLYSEEVIVEIGGSDIRERKSIWQRIVALVFGR